MQFFYPDPNHFSSTQQFASHALYRPDGTWTPIEPLDEFGDARRLGLLSFAVRCPKSGVVYDALVGSFYSNYREFLEGMGHRYPILMGIALSLEPPIQSVPRAAIKRSEQAVTPNQSCVETRRTSPATAPASVSMVRIPVPTGKKDALTAAYEGFIAGDNQSGEWLAGEIRAFGLKKAQRDLFDMRELAVTPDDVAQEIVITVLNKIHQVRGDSNGFYSWLNRISYTTGAKAVNEGTEEAKNRVDIFVVNEDGDIDENPELHKFSADRSVYLRPLPHFIQGEDEEICWYIRDGYSYPEIAKLMGTTIHALESRIHRMKKKVLAAKKAGTIK